MKNKKAQLRGKADKLWFQALLKDNCEICGKIAVQCHHFYRKSTYGHLRYDRENGVSLCKGCHFLAHHQDPKKIEEKIIEIRGQKWYKALQKKSRLKPKPSYQTISYYEEQIKLLTYLTTYANIQ